ncbi:unnamed protein product [Parajaminaea phylloscopi]
MPDAAMTSPLTAQRLAIYGSASIFAATAVVAKAFRDRANFYSATVWLGRSNGCMLVLFNFGVFLTILFAKVCQAIFFGPLRSIEIEHLYERSWYAITETLLAMTIFRDEFDASFVALFGTLLFLKMFHWLCADRVELMEQSPSVTRLFHARMISVLWSLMCLDVFLVAFAVEVLFLDKKRMGIMTMFASEFMILTATLAATIAKYVINWIDLRSEEPWEGKSIWVSGVDLVTDFLKLATYLCFFSLILTYYGLPLNIVRDVYVTARSFFGRIRDLVRYRAATRNMDTRFPNATTEDLSRTDATCIICRDEMVARDARDSADDSAGGQGPPQASGGLNDTPKKLHCGHVFHFHCLRSWLERQQSCPTCRRTVFDAQQATDSGTRTNVPPQTRGAMPPAGTAGTAPSGQSSTGNPHGQENSPTHLHPASATSLQNSAAVTTQRATAHTDDSAAAVHSAQSSHSRLRSLIDQALDRPALPAPYVPPHLRRLPNVGPSTDRQRSSGSRPSDSGWEPPTPQSLAMPPQLYDYRADKAHNTYSSGPNLSGTSNGAPVASELSKRPGPAGSSSSTTSPRQDQTGEPDMLSADPEDPRAAARLAALKRFRAVESTLNSSTNRSAATESLTSSSRSGGPAKIRSGSGVPFISTPTIDADLEDLSVSDRLSPSDFALLSQPSRIALEAQAKVVEEMQRTLWAMQQDLATALSCIPTVSATVSATSSATRHASHLTETGPELRVEDDDDTDDIGAGAPKEEASAPSSAELKGKRAAEGINAPSESVGL